MADSKQAHLHPHPAEGAEEDTIGVAEETTAARSVAAAGGDTVAIDAQGAAVATSPRPILVGITKVAAAVAMAEIVLALDTVEADMAVAMGEVATVAVVLPAVMRKATTAILALTSASNANYSKRKSSKPQASTSMLTTTSL